MSLQSLSQELKELISGYDTRWFLGDLSGLMKNIASGRANDQLGQLSSPLRQLYFLGGLLITSDNADGNDIQYDPEKWDQIVTLLNAIEEEYDKMFFPKKNKQVNESWQHVRKVAMPSFLAYFNQGPLNYEEQMIDWVTELYSNFDEHILEKTGLTTANFLEFYDNLDELIQQNFNSFGFPKGKVKPDWQKYTTIKMAEPPIELGFKIDDKQKALFTFMSDHGIINRFYPDELVSETLSIDQVKAILSLLSTTRAVADFLYYTATRPGNPLYEKPVIDLEDGLYQVFEVKQVIHAIDGILEKVCSDTGDYISRLTKRKGKLLEDKVAGLFTAFLKKDFEIHKGYFVDGNEQDILILWKDFAFIIEAKGYNIREPLRDPEKAFVRIKNDFKSSIGYGYEQARRVEKYFTEGKPLKICDDSGRLIKEIDTTRFKDNAFSIIVNLKSFGQIQADLSTLLEVDDDSSFPWAVKVDDLEVFFLTMIAKKKKPDDFIEFLTLREKMHDKLICSDELEVCAAFLKGEITEEKIEAAEMIAGNPDSTEIFDEQYRAVMGFKNEKNLAKKQSGKYIFW